MNNSKAHQMFRICYQLAKTGLDGKGILRLIDNCVGRQCQVGDSQGEGFLYMAQFLLLMAAPLTISCPLWDLFFLQQNTI